MSLTSISSITSDTVLHVKHIAVEWEIKNFFDLQDDDYVLNSPSFRLSEAEWCIQCNPNGEKNNNSAGWTSLYLSKKCSQSEHCAMFTLGLKRADGSVFRSFNCSYMFPKEGQTVTKLHEFVRRSDLVNSKDAVAPDGVLKVFCTVSLDDHCGLDVSCQTSFSDSVETLSQNVKDLFLSGYEGDVKIRVKDKELVAHKLILAARSTVFRSMFELEKSSGEVNITDCEPDCFQDFLLFLYSGKLDIVSSNNAMGLYLVSDKYNIKDLKSACCEFMAREISIESVCDVLHLASVHIEPKLLDSATEYFANNANSIFKTPKWCSFLAENLTLANELLIKMTNKTK